MSSWDEIIKRESLTRPNTAKRELRRKGETQANTGAVAALGGAGVTSLGYRDLKAGGRAHRASNVARAAGVAEEAKSRPYTTRAYQGQAPTGRKSAGPSTSKEMVLWKPNNARSAPHPNPDFQTGARQAASYFAHAQNTRKAAKRLRTRGGLLAGGGLAAIGGGAALLHRGNKNYKEANRMPNRIKKSDGRLVAVDKAWSQNRKRKVRRGALIGAGTGGTLVFVAAGPKFGALASGVGAATGGGIGYYKSIVRKEDLSRRWNQGRNWTGEHASELAAGGSLGVAGAGAIGVRNSRRNVKHGRAQEAAARAKVPDAKAKHRLNIDEMVAHQTVANRHRKNANLSRTHGYRLAPGWYDEKVGWGKISHQHDSKLYRSAQGNVNRHRKLASFYRNDLRSAHQGIRAGRKLQTRGKVGMAIGGAAVLGGAGSAAYFGNKSRKRVHKAWGDRKAHHSIQQSEQLARNARKRKRKSLQAAGVAATGIGVASAFGNVPAQTHRIIHAGREGKNLLGGFRQVGGAAMRNPAGAAALGSAALGAGALGTWAVSHGQEGAHNKRADTRRRANYDRARRVNKAWKSDEPKYRVSRRGHMSMDIRTGAVGPDATDEVHYKYRGKSALRRRPKYDVSSHVSLARAKKEIEGGRVPVEQVIGGWHRFNRGETHAHIKRAQHSKRTHTGHKVVHKAFPFKKTRQAAHATNTAAQHAANSFAGASERIGPAAEKFGNLSDKVSGLLPSSKGKALAVGLGLATAAGTPSGVGSYLGNRPNRKKKVKVDKAIHPKVFATPFKRGVLHRSSVNSRASWKFKNGAEGRAEDVDQFRTVGRADNPFWNTKKTTTHTRATSSRNPGQAPTGTRNVHTSVKRGSLTPLGVKTAVGGGAVVVGGGAYGVHRKVKKSSPVSPDLALNAVSRRGTLRAIRLAANHAKVHGTGNTVVYHAAKHLKPKHFNKLQKIYASAIELQPTG